MNNFWNNDTQLLKAAGLSGDYWLEVSASKVVLGQTLSLEELAGHYIIAHIDANRRSLGYLPTTTLGGAIALLCAKEILIKAGL